MYTIMFVSEVKWRGAKRAQLLIYPINTSAIPNESYLLRGIVNEDRWPH